MEYIPTKTQTLEVPRLRIDWGKLQIATSDRLHAIHWPAPNPKTESGRLSLAHADVLRSVARNQDSIPQCKQDARSVLRDPSGMLVLPEAAGGSCVPTSPLGSMQREFSNDTSSEQQPLCSPMGRDRPG